MLNELEKNRLSVSILRQLSYESKLGRQMNNWLHKYLYKRGYSDSVGRTLRQEYENGKILREQEFEEVLKHVLSDSEEI